MFRKRIYLVALLLITIHGFGQSGKSYVFMYQCFTLFNDPNQPMEEAIYNLSQTHLVSQVFIIDLDCIDPTKISKPNFYGPIAKEFKKYAKELYYRPPGELFEREAYFGKPVWSINADGYSTLHDPEYDNVSFKFLGDINKMSLEEAYNKRNETIKDKVSGLYVGDPQKNPNKGKWMEFPISSECIDVPGLPNDQYASTKIKTYQELVDKYPHSSFRALKIDQEDFRHCFVDVEVPMSPYEIGSFHCNKYYFLSRIFENSLNPNNNWYLEKHGWGITYLIKTIESSILPDYDTNPILSNFYDHISQEFKNLPREGKCRNDEISIGIKCFWSEDHARNFLYQENGYHPSFTDDEYIFTEYDPSNQIEFDQTPKTSDSRMKNSFDNDW